MSAFAIPTSYVVRFASLRLRRDLIDAKDEIPHRVPASVQTSHAPNGCNEIFRELTALFQQFGSTAIVRLDFPPAEFQVLGVVLTTLPD